MNHLRLTASGDGDAYSLVRCLEARLHAAAQPLQHLALPGLGAGLVLQCRAGLAPGEGMLDVAQGIEAVTAEDPVQALATP